MKASVISPPSTRIAAGEAQNRLAADGPYAVADLAQHPVRRALAESWAPAPGMLEAAQRQTPRPSVQWACAASAAVAIQRPPQLGVKGPHLKPVVDDRLIEHKPFVDQQGQNLPKVHDWARNTWL